MDFIDSYNQQQQQQDSVFCPACDCKMMFATKGKLTGNYICGLCGVTNYLEHTYSFLYFLY